jgi:hypothetical protein
MVVFAETPDWGLPMNLLPFALAVVSCAAYLAAMSQLGRMLARARQASGPVLEG